MLSEGATMPEFSLPDQNGRIFKSKDYIGKPLVIYFYPKDNTPGVPRRPVPSGTSYGEYEKRGVHRRGYQRRQSGLPRKVRPKV